MGVYALRSSMFALDFSTDPLFECADDNARDLAFVHATSLIGGRDTVEEYLAYGLFPLSVGLGFGEITDGETPVSKVTLPLPESPLTRLQGENNDHFLASVELGTENVVGGYIHMEHDACILLLPNDGRLNRIFEQAGVAYSPRPEPSSKASKEAARKRKNDAVTGPVGKQTKVPDKKKVDAPKASVTSKTVGVALSKADFTPTRVALKPGVLPKVATQKRLW
jgi:hypothetical protein